MAGMITREMIARAMQDLWESGRKRPDFTGLRAVLDNLENRRYSPLMCGARLFAPDEPVLHAIRMELVMTGTPVHPRDLPWLAPVQGPAPAVCAREPHPGSPWHRDGTGTWWK